MTDPDHIDELLQHAQWVRRVARSLVTGEAQVDDVVQQTWLVALQQRPRDPARLRAWLGGIARNLARRQGRGERRRQRREQAQPAPAPQPSTDELVARAESQAVLARAVVALPEPYRSTLLLRYVEDLSAAQIARRQGLPAATVRTRQRRALDLLRQQLDEDFGAPRRDWCLGLVPLALSAPKIGTLTTVGTLLTGATVMSAKSFVAVVGVALLATAAWIIEPFGSGTASAPAGSSASAAPVVAAAPASAAAPGANAALLADAGTPQALAAPAVEPAATDDTPAAPTDTLTGQVLGADGRPLPDAEVRFAWHTSDDPRLLGLDQRPSPARTDTDGRFGLSLALDRKSQEWLERTVLVILHDQHVTTLHGLPPLHPGHQDTGPIRLAHAGRVVAQVFDEQQRPLADATLTLTSWQARDPGDLVSGEPRTDQRLREGLTRVVQTTSDARGRLELTGLPTGAVDLELARADRARLPIPGVEVNTGSTTDLGRLVLPEGLRLSGTVLGLDGEPRAEVPVFVEHLRPTPAAKLGDDPSHRTTALVHTDAAGRFVAGGLLPGPHRVSARADDTPFTHLEPVEAGTDRLELILAPPGEVIFSVRDAVTGALLPEVSVWTNLPDAYDTLTRATRDGLRYQPGGQLAADLQPGLFRVTGAGREGVELAAKAEGYTRAVLVTEPVPPGGTVSADLLLQPSLPFTGVVIDETGAPVAGATVQIAPRSGAAAGSGTIMHRPADDGRFALDGAPGTWWLWVDADGHDTTLSAEVSLPEDAEQPFVVQLARQFSVRGQVADLDGEAVPGANVVALPASAPWEAAVERWDGLPIGLRSDTQARPVTSVADELGRYHLLGLAPGRHVVLATRTPLDLSAYGSADGLPDPAPRGVVALELGETTDVSLDLITVEGAVVSGRVSAHGEPAAGVTVGVVARTAGEARWRFAATTTTDEQGAYRLSGLLPGRAVLVTRAEDGYPDLRPLELLDGDQLLEDVELDGLTIRGTVVDADTDEPLEGVQVVCGPGAPDGWQWPLFERLDEATLGRLRNEILGRFAVTRITGADGRFECHNLPPSRLWFELDRSGYLPGWVPERERTEASGQRTFTMTRGAILEGVIHGDTSGFRGGLMVELIDRHDGRRAKNCAPRAGGWLLDPVDVGDYELRLVTRDDPPWVLHTETLQVEHGDHLQFEWELD